MFLICGVVGSDKTKWPINGSVEPGAFIHLPRGHLTLIMNTSNSVVLQIKVSSLFSIRLNTSIYSFQYRNLNTVVGLIYTLEARFSIGRLQ